MFDTMLGVCQTGLPLHGGAIENQWAYSNQEAVSEGELPTKTSQEEV